ncbi:FKBP-type peptidyl-prolyl cis-trans isomerase [Brevibacterium luteolum]|uniref:FKBP-type peptidyl-prolyl cis-trans isomerase n=1 Tax=Brevibacterium luteolum TaxID=199591 RepID=UPI003EEE30F5
MRRTLIGALAVSALLLTGCGADDSAEGNPAENPTVDASNARSTSLDDVEVTGEPDQKPEVSFEAPLVMEEPSSKVISKGDGPELKEGQQVTANLTLLSGNSGKELESSYENKNPAGFPLTKEGINSAAFDALVGLPVGSRLLITFNGPYKSGDQPETLVYIFDILKAEDLPEPMDKAEGKERELPAGLPKVTRDDTGKPSVEAPEGDAPKDLVVEPTIEGEGPEVKEGQKVKAQYTGWLYDDVTKPFDSSWDRGEPFEFTAGGGEVIAGWDEAVVGQKYGSQLLLIIPPGKGYGEQGSPPNIPGNSTLIFVVDVLPPDQK